MDPRICPRCKAQLAEDDHFYGKLLGTYEARDWRQKKRVRSWALRSANLRGCIKQA
jgi:hypothetical protein